MKRKRKKAIWKCVLFNAVYHIYHEYITCSFYHKRMRYELRQKSVYLRGLIRRKFITNRTLSDLCQIRHKQVLLRALYTLLFLAANYNKSNRWEFIQPFVFFSFPVWNIGPLSGFLWSHIHLDTWYGSFGRVTSPPQRPLPTQDNTTYEYKRQTSHAPSGIRTSDPGNQAAADLRLTPRGRWDRQRLRISGRSLVSHCILPQK
jgi:hypothetical protein